VKLYPAIDILGGSAVRLVKGDFDSKNVVDLDGAKSGQPVNLDQLRRIASLGVPVQYGGGLRSLDAVDQALGAGAERAILGTAAFTDQGLLERALETHGPERIVVSVDVRGGEVSIEGWTKSAEVGVREVFATLTDRGVQELAYTNVDRDGMLGGLNFEDLIRVAKAAEQGHLLYSGGIGDIEDLRHLAKLRAEAHLENLTGVIVGKALYEGRFTIAQAHEALAG
jgi:phosphoribosylformimino-5-aminoimidazole carboxamide ribotide isomerase